MKTLALICLLLPATIALAQFNFNKLNEFTDKFKAANNIGRDASKVVKGASGIGVKEELVIGGSVAVEIVAKFGGLVRDEAITRRANLIGKSLAYYCDRPELTYRFGVLKSPSVNAFSAPGGYVFITRGLYDLLENDDQLAGVLAHEITHVTERHALKIIARGEFFDGAASLATDAGAAGKNRNFPEFSKGIKQITSTLFEKGFDPQTEYTADTKGSRLADSTNYAADGLKQCLESLQKRQSGRTEMFSTHPPLKNRIAKLD